MIAGLDGAQICDSCVTICKSIIDRENESSLSAEPEATQSKPFNLLKPDEIKAYLDESLK